LLEFVPQITLNYIRRDINESLSTDTQVYLMRRTVNLSYGSKPSARPAIGWLGCLRFIMRVTVQARGIHRGSRTEIFQCGDGKRL
jgi:hypothetical protein